MHVFVSGAGPVGMSAAIALVERGHGVTIIDRDPGITHESRAVGVASGTLALLAPSGIGDRILAEGTVIRRVQALEDGEPLTELKVPGQSRRWPTIVALAQSETERLLETRLTELGVAVAWNSELQALRQDDGGVVATVADRTTGAQREIAADYALGADGSRSRTREALGITLEGHAMPESWSLADCILDWRWPEAQACVNLGNDGSVLFMITIGAPRYRLISNRPDCLDRARALMGVGEVFWSNPFHVRLSVADAMRRGRCFLAGDAAHTHSPVGGRGMNLGIADAFAFADAVDKGELDAYEPARLKAARRTVDMTDSLYRFATRQSPAGRVRDLVFRSAGVLTRALA